MTIPYWRVRLQTFADEFGELPNTISFLRPYFLFIVALCVMSENYLAGLILYLTGAFTDFLDGWVARKFNMITETGKMFDPLMDKLYFVPVLAILYPPEGIGSMLSWLIAFEGILLLMGLYAFFASCQKNIQLGANVNGKIKVGVEIVAAVMLFCEKMKIFIVSDAAIELVVGIAALYAFLSIVGHIGARNAPISRRNGLIRQSQNQKPA